MSLSRVMDLGLLALRIRGSPYGHLTPTLSNGEVKAARHRVEPRKTQEAGHTACHRCARLLSAASAGRQQREKKASEKGRRKVRKGVQTPYIRGGDSGAFP